MPKNIHTPEEIEDCKRIYIELNGQNRRLLVKKMKEKGWKNFNLNLLCTRRRRDGLLPGWPEQFEWDKELKNPELRREQNPALRRYNFELWLNETFPDWTWSWKYQRYLYRRLHDVTTGKCKRLMIFLPPRHGKSELVTVRYAAWRMIEDANLNVILGSYNQRLANRFSRKIKRIVLTQESSEIQENFPQSGKDAKEQGKDGATKQHEGTRNRKTQKNIQKKQNLTQSVEEWETSGGGGLRAVGVGGGITGFGANLIVIDDPIKSRAEAESETFRENVWDWFNDDLYTRLEPDAAIILIQTRWHEDDLAGRLLREMEDGGEKWEVVSFPALAEAGKLRNADRGSRNQECMSSVGCELSDKDLTTDKHRKTQIEENLAADERGRTRTGNGVKSPRSSFRNPQSKKPPANADGSDLLGRREGEALCPGRFDRKALLRIKAKLGSYGFSALYQQDPIPAGGGAFKREWFRQIIDTAPTGLRWARGYDLAVSTKTSADYTASFRCAFDRAGNLYIADGFRKRIEYPEQRRYVVERMKEEKDTRHDVEAALHGQALVQDLRREPSIRFRPLRSVRVDGDKLTRALAWANLAEEGKVVLVRGPWIADFLEEVCRFTGRNDRHDDQVDAVSLAVRLLSEKDKRLYGF